MSNLTSRIFEWKSDRERASMNNNHHQNKNLQIIATMLLIICRLKSCLQRFDLQTNLKEFELISKKKRMWIDIVFEIYLMIDRRMTSLLFPESSDSNRNRRVSTSKRLVIQSSVYELKLRGKFMFTISLTEVVLVVNSSETCLTFAQRESINFNKNQEQKKSFITINCIRWSWCWM